jgi:hypothetical protein
MRQGGSIHMAMSLAIAVGILSCRGAGADDEPPENLSGWQRLFREHAAGYKIVVQGHEEPEVKLLDKPVLQWSQPVRGGADGAVFIWVQEARPVAIGTLFIWPMDNGRQGISHELHSLSQAPFVATWKDRQWTPPKDSIVWTSVADAPAPAAAADRRLRQMREIARQFQAESRDHDGRQWELRLLPRPIHRYELDGADVPPAAQREVLDGALFGLVEGTDLEIVLAIEAHKTVEGHEWQYTLARMSDFRLKVTHGGKTVWEVERSGYDNPRVAYYCSTVDSRKSAEEE